jgi:hypothetical protein
MNPEQGATGQETRQRLGAFEAGNAAVNTSPTPSANPNAQPNTSRSDESRGQGDTRSVDNNAFSRLLNEKVNSLTDDNEKKLAYNALLILNASINDISELYENLVAANLGDKEKTTKKILEGITLLIYKIFEPVLDLPPNLDWINAQSQGAQTTHLGYQISPIQIYNELIQKKFAALKSAVQGSEERQFIGAGIVEEKEMLPNGQTVTVSKKLKYTPMSLSNWLETMLQSADREVNALSLSHNLGYVLRTAKKRGQNPLEEITKFTSSLSSEDFDQLSFLPGGTEVTAGEMALAQSWMALFMDTGYKTDMDKLSPSNTEDFLAEKWAYERVSRLQENRLLIKRGVLLGRIEVYGRELLPWLLASMSEVTGPTPQQGEVARIFRLFDSTTHWMDGEALMSGISFLPAKSGVANPLDIRDKSIKLYKSSQKMGLLPIISDSDFREGLMWVSKPNFFNQGGVEGGGGWRMKFQIASLLRSGYKDKQILQAEGFNFNKEYGETLFTDGFKALENVGVDVLRNFLTEMVLDADNLKLKDGNYEYLTHFENLFKYIYKRCFSEGKLGACFYTSIKDENAYWDHIKKYIFSNDTGISAESRADELRKHIYNALTVILIERNPTQIVSVEPVATSQNGVTLYSQMRRDFFKNKSHDWGFAKSLENFDIKFKEAFENLQLAESILRSEITEMMLTKDGRSKSEMRYGEQGFSGNAYDYVLSKENLEKILKGLKINDEQIARACNIYLYIKENLWKKPEATKDDEVLNKYTQEEYQRLEKKYIKQRMSYFSHAWREGLLGVEFTYGTADVFLERSAAGNNLITGVASEINDITSTFKGYFEEGDNFIYSKLKDFVQNDEATFDDVISIIKGVYGKMKGTDLDKAKKGVATILNFFIQGARAPANSDSKTAQFFAKFNSWFDNKKYSIIGSDKIGSEGSENTITEEMINDFISTFLEGTILKEETSMSHQLVPIDEDELQKAEEEGREPKMKWIEVVNPINGIDILKKYKARLFDIVKGMAPTVALVFVLAFAWGVIKPAWDQSRQ